MSQPLRPDSYARTTLERYTGSSIEEFGSYILLVNFQRYIDRFSGLTGSPIKQGHWTAAHDREKDISIINFGVGSPSAGIIMHCLSFLDKLECVIMLGMCGGIDSELQIGDLLVPTASVRDEGTSKHYLPKDVPAQPSFRINQVCEDVIRQDLGLTPKTGIMLTTDYRMWEFDESFISYILRHRILAVDMEIATIFSVAYAQNVPTGSIMLISDMPLKKGGIKSKESADKVFSEFTDRHLRVGLKAIEEIKKKTAVSGRLKSEW